MGSSQKHGKQPKKVLIVDGRLIIKNNNTTASTVNFLLSFSISIFLFLEIRSCKRLLNGQFQYIDPFSYVYLNKIKHYFPPSSFPKLNLC